MQPVETRQGPGLEEPSRPSWEPCRGHQRRGEGVGSPAAGVAAARCSCWLYKVRQCSERPRFFTDRLRLSPRLAISSISTRPEQARSERKTKQEVPRYVSHLCPPRNLSVRHPTALKSHNKAALKSTLNTILISVFIFSLRNSKATERIKNCFLSFTLKLKNNITANDKSNKITSKQATKQKDETFLQSTFYLNICTFMFYWQGKQLINQIKNVDKCKCFCSLRNWRQDAINQHITETVNNKYKKIHETLPIDVKAKLHYFGSDT